MKKNYSGINIQYPYSRLILNGLKKIETRTYPLPNKYVGVPLALIETPGNVGVFRSRIIGLITFESSFLYQTKRQFYSDFNRHHVDKKSFWAWREGKPKWGWTIGNIVKFSKPMQLTKRPGIVFTLNIELSQKSIR